MPSERIDPSWRKALLGARLLLSKRPRTQKRVLLARSIGNDPAVTPRLLDQAIACTCVKQGLDYEREVARIKVGTQA